MHTLKAILLLPKNRQVRRHSIDSIKLSFHWQIKYYEAAELDYVKRRLDTSTRLWVRIISFEWRELHVPLLDDCRAKKSKGFSQVAFVIYRTWYWLNIMATNAVVGSRSTSCCFSASKLFYCINNFKKHKNSGFLVYFNMKNSLKRKLLLRTYNNSYL